MRFLFVAYLDPGSGSLFLQVVIGAVAAALFALKTYWLRIKAFFCRKPGPSDADGKK